MVSDVHHGLAAYGWVDGNPVHFLTSADGTGEAEVTRRISQRKENIKAPVCIKRYNHGMQAVDRHDQLRQTFALADRHVFKKYYVKIALGLIDMAVVNAYIHYKLVNPERDNKKQSTARYDFLQDLAQSFLTTDWDNYGDTDTGRTNEYVLRSLVLAGNREQGTEDNSGLVDLTTTEGGKSASNCVPISVSRFLKADSRSNKEGLVCQVCRFEERGSKIRSVVMCVHHNIRLCTKSHPFVTLRKKDGSEVTDYSWMAPDHSRTCWRKAHAFYIPKGLFNDNPSKPSKNGKGNGKGNGGRKPAFQNIRTSSECYKKKRSAFGAPAGRRGRSKKSPLANKRKRDDEIAVDDIEAILDGLDEQSSEEEGTDPKERAEV